jgi:peptidoglycan/LPS O-acetylase OafA/YrhL
LLLFAISLLVGPKILLLLPAWAVGAMAFHASKVWRCSLRSGLVLFMATGLAAAAAMIFQNQLGLDDNAVGKPPLFYSSDFIGDNLFGILVGAHFWACAIFSRHFVKNLEPYRIVKLTRWMAGHTFSLYLYHVPILLFLRAITKYDPNNQIAVYAAMAVTLLMIVVLSKITEEQYPNLRATLRRWIAAFLQSIRAHWKMRSSLQNF